MLEKDLLLTIPFLPPKEAVPSNQRILGLLSANAASL